MTRRSSQTTRGLLIGLWLMALVATGCGSGDDSSGDESQPGTNPPATNQAEDSDDGDNEGGSQSSGLPPGGSGSVTINGETIEPAWVGNCMIDDMFDPQPGDLDINVSLDGGLEALFLEISNMDVIGVPPDADAYTYMQFRPELQLRTDSGSFGNFEAGPFVTGPDGTWYVDEIGNVPRSLAMDLAHEGVEMDAAPLEINGNNLSGSFTVEGESGPLDVTFDLDIVEAVDCSL